MKHNFNEYADFGLDVTQSNERKTTPDGDKPILPLNVEYIINQLKRKNLGPKMPLYNNFFGEVQWGTDDGAIKLSFSPLGGIRASLRKLVHDLKGDPVWICKKVVEIRHFFDEHPDSLTFKLEENLQAMDAEGIDAPSADFQNMERLVIRLASELRRRTTQKIFMFEGIRRISEEHKYIIHFGVTGFGRQKAQERLDQFAIFAEYYKKSGLIKIAGNELGDKLDKYRFIYQPSTFIEYFSPAQKEEEIFEAILACFNSY